MTKPRDAAFLREAFKRCSEEIYRIETKRFQQLTLDGRDELSDPEHLAGLADRLGMIARAFMADSGPAELRAGLDGLALAVLAWLEDLAIADQVHL